MSDFSSLLKLELTGTYEGVDPAMFAHYFSHVSGEPRSRYVGTQTDENGVEQRYGTQMHSTIRWLRPSHGALFPMRQRISAKIGL